MGGGWIWMVVHVDGLISRWMGKDMNGYLFDNSMMLLQLIAFRYQLLQKETLWCCWRG